MAGDSAERRTADAEMLDTLDTLLIRPVELGTPGGKGVRTAVGRRLFSPWFEGMTTLLGKRLYAAHDASVQRLIELPGNDHVTTKSRHGKKEGAMRS